MTAISAAMRPLHTQNTLKAKVNFGAETITADSAQIAEPKTAPNKPAGLEKYAEELLLYFAEKAEKNGRGTLAGILKFLAQAVKVLTGQLPQGVQD